MLKKFANIIYPLKKTTAAKRLVGTDKFNNKFYLCHDEEGKEIHRLVEQPPRLTEENMEPEWDAWLRHRIVDPPIRKFAVAATRVEHSADEAFRTLREDDKWRYSYLKKDLIYGNSMKQAEAVHRKYPFTTSVPLSVSMRRWKTMLQTLRSRKQLKTSNKNGH